MGWWVAQKLLWNGQCMIWQNGKIQLRFRNRTDKSSPGLKIAIIGKIIRWHFMQTVRTRQRGARFDQVRLSNDALCKQRNKKQPKNREEKHQRPRDSGKLFQSFLCARQIRRLWSARTGKIRRLAVSHANKHTRKTPQKRDLPDTRCQIPHDSAGKIK